MADQDDEAPARCPGPNYQDVLDGCARPAPGILREEAATPRELHDWSTDVYLSREQHAREVEHLWRRVWQIAGRVEDVAEPGDSFVYDVADDSLIVVRTKSGELRAYHNSCLHRGTRLRDEAGHLPAGEVVEPLLVAHRDDVLDRSGRRRPVAEDPR